MVECWIWLDFFHVFCAGGQAGRGKEGQGVAGRKGQAERGRQRGAGRERQAERGEGQGVEVYGQRTVDGESPALRKCIHNFTLLVQVIIEIHTYAEILTVAPQNKTRRYTHIPRTSLGRAPTASRVALSSGVL